MRVWQSIADTLKGGGACVMVSVAEGAGSTPRDPGARMIVRQDGSLAGTIGGGHLEYMAHQVAMDMLAGVTLPPEISLEHSDRGRRFARRTFSLGPDLGQCCGGRVDLTLEVFAQSDLQTALHLAEIEVLRGPFATRMPLLDGRAGERVVLPSPTLASRPETMPGEILEQFGQRLQPLYLFGAGHVGKAIVLALAALPFDVVWVDTRREVFPSHMPGHLRMVLSTDPSAEVAGAPPGAFVLVLTHDHALDEDIVLTALKREVFPFVGMIGSVTKRKRFQTRLKARGLSPSVFDTLICPIGNGRLRSKLPAAIAADVTLQLLETVEGLETQGRSDETVAEGLAKLAGLGR